MLRFPAATLIAIIVVTIVISTYERTPVYFHTILNLILVSPLSCPDPLY